jgi:hypothetical protein
LLPLHNEKSNDLIGSFPPLEVPKGRNGSICLPHVDFSAHDPRAMASLIFKKATRLHHE